MATKSVDDQETLDDNVFLWEDRPTTTRLDDFLMKIPASGIICGALAGLFTAAVKLSVKLLPHLDPLTISGFEGLILYVTIVLVFLVLLARGNIPRIKHLGLMLLYSLFASSSGCLIICCLKYIPLADASAIISSYPILVAVMAHLLFAEPFGCCDVILLVGIVIGIVSISTPSFMFPHDKDSEPHPGNRLTGILMACGAACTYAGFSLVARKIRDAPQLYSMMMKAGIMTAIGFAGSGICGTYRTPSYEELAIMVAGGLSLACSDFVGLQAYRLEHAAPVALATLSNLVFALFFQVIIFMQYPTRSSMVGVYLICSCVALMALRRWKTERPEKFRWMDRIMPKSCSTYGRRTSASSTYSTPTTSVPKQ